MENKYHCRDCIACTPEEHKHKGDTYKCKFDGQPITHDVDKQSPCNRFHPEKYITALNYDTR